MPRVLTGAFEDLKPARTGNNFVALAGKDYAEGAKFHVDIHKQFRAVKASHCRANIQQISAPSSPAGRARKAPLPESNDERGESGEGGSRGGGGGGEGRPSSPVFCQLRPPETQL
jgi:hypothetical protein